MSYKKLEEILAGREAMVYHESDGCWELVASGNQVAQEIMYLLIEDGAEAECVEVHVRVIRRGVGNEEN